MQIFGVDKSAEITVNWSMRFTNARGGGGRSRAREVVKERPVKRDELNAASRSRVCNVDLAQFSRSCCAARIAAPVSDVLDEYA